MEPENLKANGLAERRHARRYDLSLPIAVRLPAHSEPAQRNGQTRDVSTRGVYFTMEDELTPGMEFDLTLTLPAEVTRGTDVFIRGRGRVVRIDRRSEGDRIRVGVAAVMESYEIIRADGAVG